MSEEPVRKISIWQKIFGVAKFLVAKQFDTHTTPDGEKYVGFKFKLPWPEKNS